MENIEKKTRISVGDQTVKQPPVSTRGVFTHRREADDIGSCGTKCLVGRHHDSACHRLQKKGNASALMRMYMLHHLPPHHPSWITFVTYHRAQKGHKIEAAPPPVLSQRWAKNWRAQSDTVHLWPPALFAGTPPARRAVIAMKRER